MSRRVQVSYGETAELQQGHLRVRLVNGTGAKLVVSGVAGDSYSRESDDTVLVNPGAHQVLLSVRPVAGDAFAPGTRLGLEVDVVGGDDMHHLPVGLDVARLDVGAFRSLDVLDCLPDGQAWRVGVGVPAPGPFHFDTEGAVVPRLDERTESWVAPGRYVLRAARKGRDAPTSGRRWALVLDSSASFQSRMDAGSLADATRLLAGLIAEDSGRAPSWLGVTGLSAPERAAGDPAEISQALDPAAPASWCLLVPAMCEAWDADARTIVLFADSEPSDLGAVRDLLRDRPGHDVLVVLAGDSGRSVARGQDAPYRVTHVVPRDDVPAVEWDWAPVCSAMTGGVR